MGCHCFRSMYNMAICASRKRVAGVRRDTYRRVSGFGDVVLSDTLQA